MKRYIISSVTALFISTNTFADDISYSLEKQSLKNAIEAISKKANKQYLVDSSLLNGKSSNEIKNIKGTNNALIEVLKDSGLIFSIEDNVIIIKSRKTIENGTLLDEISVNEGYSNGTAESGYVVKELKQVGPWGEKSLQDTPYSMTVIPQELIENTVSGNIDQLFKMTPTIQESAPTTIWGYPNAVIRGFGTSTSAVDGMKMSSYTYGISTEEIERLEVMNGLSGFMYGAGNVGGITNYVLKRPTYQRLTNLTLGNYGGEQYYAHLDLGNKIDEQGKFAYRLNAVYQDGETSKDDQNVEKKLISGALDWNVTDDFQLQLEAAHKFWRVDRPDNRFYTQGITGWPKAFDNEKTFSPDWTYNQTKTDRVGLNATWDINDIFTLRTAYMYKKDDRESIIIYPIYTPNGWTMYNPVKAAPYDTISQSAYAYLDSKFDTGSISHKLTIGISGETYKERKHINSNITNSSYVIPSGIPSGLTSEQLMDLASPSFSSDYSSKYKANETTSKNIIIGDDITFNEQWSALVGFNYSTVENEVFNTSGTQTSKYDESELTPTLSLIYKPFEDLTTYASYIEGLERGSVVPNDPNVYNNAGEILDPYVSKQYEVGAKYSVSQNLLLSSALFRIEKANSYEETTSNGKKTINQDGLQIHQGLELTVTGKITDNLTVMTGGTLMDLEIDKATNPSLKGKKPTGAASKMAKFYAEYNLPFLSGLTLTGGAYYTGGKYQDNLNKNKIDDYTIYDVGLRYKTKLDKYSTTFNFNVTNLTGEDYWATTWQLGNPRNIAFSMKMDF
ncbi:TonB-dependent receptor [Aliarcobacter thereius]|uniref:Ferrichrome receptor FcuA n=1 Tax=Aliarcobacter thereius LMG 24486 TaxID=1032240 RepID=A0A1C7WP15_9BACT|nr:TonB-dependent receptor [Aliarcobacter thereius]OCL95506.1 Ferrichrome receptor FcuA precursor [Aliarcobacter thereius LMG 24486]QBF16507.1 TonB-dependent siderophore receptor [Aliarcobacter thereius LMG 24486]TLS93766.1 TonB-dependent receptor [Aliarcobacter thereius]